jgi:hypothetical protein
MPSAVGTASSEISAALDAMAAPHEGLRDFSRLNIRPETLVEVRVSIEQYDRRARLLTDARKAIDALVADGYPELNAREAAASVIADLQANAESIEVALRLFGTTTASTLRLAHGAPEPK